MTAFGENAKKPRIFSTTDEHDIQTATVQRFLEFRGIEAGKPVARSLHYADHGNYTDVNFTHPDVEHQASSFVTNHFFMEEKNDRKQIPAPILYFYVGRKPLHEAIPQGEFLGTARCLDRDCDLFLFKQVRWARSQDQVFYLDQKTSIPLKVEAYRDAEAREKKRPIFVWEAKSLDSIQGYSVPFLSSSTTFDQDGQKEYASDFKVERIRFNDPIPESTFRPDLQPGIPVLNGVTQKSYLAPGVAAKPEAQPGATVVPSPALLATPPRDWSGTVVTGILVLGVTLLCAGAVAWWRRR